MTQPYDITEAIMAVDEINDLCRELRQGFLLHNPDAPPSRSERELVEAVLYIRKHYGVDWTPFLDVLPNALRKRIAEAT